MIGYQLFNKYGLTTQVSKVVEVYSKVAVQRTKNIRNVIVHKLDLIYNANTISMIEILEILQEYKSIEDLNKKNFLKYLEEVSKNYDENSVDIILQKIQYKKSTLASLKNVLDYYFVSNTLTKYLRGTSTYKALEMEELYESTRPKMKEFFLKSVRIGFSIWSENDICDALELWGNSEVTKFIVAEGNMSKEQVQQRLKKEIESYNNYNIQYWSIYLIETNENVGCCGLRPYDFENNILEMGIHLKEKYWGKGIAKEACSAIIEYAFNTLNANALFAGHNPKNIASAQLLKKLGFTYTHDEYYPPTKLYHPSYLMEKQKYMDVH